MGAEGRDQGALNGAVTCVSAAATARRLSKFLDLISDLARLRRPMFGGDPKGLQPKSVHENNKEQFW